jgi:hypothetical protein
MPMIATGSRARRAVAAAASGASRARRRPARDDIELAREEAGPAEMALHLAARRRRNRARREEGDRVHLQPVIARDRLPDRAEETFVVGARRARNLVDDHDALVSVDVDRERGAASGRQRVVAARDGVLEIFRLMIEAAHDDEVLQPTRDEQATIPDEAQVARAEEGPITRVVEPRAEHRRRLVAALPVAAPDAGTGDPDLADLIGLARRGRARVHDQHARVVGGEGAADQALRRRARLRRIDDALRGERAAGHGTDDRRPRRRAAGDEQRRFGEAIAWIERLAAKAARRERVGEARERLGPDRLRARERDVPAAEVELGALLGADALDAELVGEVRPAAGGAAIPRHRAQPSRGLLEECRRRHDDHRKSRVQRLDDTSDQAHVVVRRQPVDGDAAAVQSERACDRVGVVQDVRVGQHHALG